MSTDNTTDNTTATQSLSDFSKEVWNKEQQTRTLRDKLRQNGGLTIYNFHHGEGTMSTLFAIEPYVYFFLGIAISIWIVVNGISSGNNVGKGLSWTWIIMGVFSIITLFVGAHKSESHLNSD